MDYGRDRKFSAIDTAGLRSLIATTHLLQMDSNRRQILKLGVVDVGVEHASLPNGVEIDLAVIRHPGAAAIVALDDSGNIAMLSQYRNAMETPLQCAQRELAEEAGLSARRWDHLGSIVTIPSFCDERIELYLARELDSGSGTLDHDEVLSVSRVPFEETFAMIRRGDIVDAKSIVALYRARDFLEQERRA